MSIKLPSERDRRPGGGTRAEIEGFSRASRRRMMLLLASLRMDELPLFVTLTYPGTFSEDPLSWKANLEAFRTWLVSHHPQASAVWKLEPQKRMAPHFHLLIWGVDFLPAEVLAAAWYRIVGSGDRRHLLAGTEVRRVYSANGVKAYAAKAYMGKEFDGFQGVGRFWGVMNKRALPMAKKESASVEVWVATVLARTGRRWMAKRGYRATTGSMEVLTSYPSQWKRLAEHLVDDRCGNRVPEYSTHWRNKVSGYVWTVRQWEQQDAYEKAARDADTRNS